MPFVLIETSDPSRTAVIPLDGVDPISVSEVCRGDTLAEVMNRIEDEELRRCRAKHEAARRAEAEAWDADDRITLGDAVPPEGGGELQADDQGDEPFTVRA